MPSFQNCLPDNRLGRDRIFSVWGLATHDWRDVGDGIRSRARNLRANPQCDKGADFLFLPRLCRVRAWKKKTPNWKSCMVRLSVGSKLHFTFAFWLPKNNAQVSSAPR